ncbi:FKBP-type peptidyl-prolyl cis-trans isomerase [Pelagicoccus sp. SDUM812003]|uniref:FKBP-type peptidyl-prolyl cis-trans isomerase n=1 Tax=Pelagicoccus sp. SDUM812003 TaxID=3041267 RepID=UPI00280D5DEC|nr:FKBP-type peptidyl-prolyl cis-trans isomerase [Pelagicoccus sp. SDUM812003]MDQ8203153.1 FKBP-type peptidyl-prolyl cis-trans isomerase [Pelagicoccus sp. SDUM812003]
MKKLLAFTSLCLLGAPLFGQLADMIELPEGMGAEDQMSYSDEELLKTWGWLLAERYNLKALELSPTEIDAVAEGMIDHVLGDQPATDIGESGLAIQEFFAKREQRLMESVLRENRAKEQAFFDQLVGLSDVQSLVSGLAYQILRPGDPQKKPEPTDMVIVHYEGRFLDNQIFDSTAGRDPAAFQLNQVIDGWTQGLQLIGEGGKIKLYVPAKLAYGDELHGSVPPGSTLVFEIELLKVGLPEEAGDVDAQGAPLASEPQATTAPQE